MTTGKRDWWRVKRVCYSDALGRDWKAQAERAGDDVTARRAQQAIDGNRAARRDVVAWEVAAGVPSRKG